MEKHDQSLRQIITEGLNGLRKEIALLRESVLSMTKQGMTENDINDFLKFQVASLSEGISELEQRVIALEQHDSLNRWVGRQFVTVVVVAVVVLLLQRFF